MKRRQFLKATGAASIAGLAGLAGCTDGDDENTDTAGGEANDTTTSTTEQTTTTTEQTTTTETSGGDGSGSGTADADDVAVDLVEHELIEGPLGYAEVRGVVENTSGSEQSYIEVEVTFYDSDEVQIGDTLWNAEDVSDGQQVEFETALSTTEYSEVAMYEVVTTTSVF